MEREGLFEEPILSKTSRGQTVTLELRRATSVLEEKKNFFIDVFEYSQTIVLLRANTVPLPNLGFCFFFFLFQAS